jgi:hypothetical protein
MFGGDPYARHQAQHHAAFLVIEFGEGPLDDVFFERRADPLDRSTLGVGGARRLFRGWGRK